jgi:hypothetical protein
VKTFILTLMLLCGIGCTNLQPIGSHSKSKPLPVGADPDLPPPPGESTAAKLVPPAIMIEAGDVNSENASASVRKLSNEFEYDWKTLPAPSKTAEISQYKNGVKVR